MAKSRKQKVIKGRTGKRVCINLSRWIYEKANNVQLSTCQFVHHKDGDKYNDDINNLEIMNNSEHTRHHHYMRWAKEVINVSRMDLYA